MKLTLPVLSQLSVEIEINDNPYDLPLEELFTMAARMNKKRAFLFVSKVLGKHIPINPGKGMLVGALLANHYMEMVKGNNTGDTENLLSAFLNEPDTYSGQAFIHDDVNPVIIGFAETATALGHAFFQCFQKADFFHTTREEIIGVEPAITFEEEHSHATSHRCYIDESILQNSREIILVDDEMTTGKTNINIIRSIQKRFPRKNYIVVSILDWRSEKNIQSYAELEKELDICIHSVSLLKGKINVAGSLNIKESKEISVADFSILPSISFISLEKRFPALFTSIPYYSKFVGGEINAIPYIKETGRFSINSKINAQLNEALAEIGTFLSNERNGKKTLCLGTGEFMFLPMKIASFMGSGVYYQSTTRSPIHVADLNNYGAKYGLSFPCPENKSVANFVYNIPPTEYDELFVFLERAVTMEDLEPFLVELEKTKIKDIKIVFFKGGETYD